MRQVVTLTPGI